MDLLLSDAWKVCVHPPELRDWPRSGAASPGEIVGKIILRGNRFCSLVHHARLPRGTETGRMYPSLFGERRRRRQSTGEIILLLRTSSFPPRSGQALTSTEMTRFLASS